MYVNFFIWGVDMNTKSLLFGLVTGGLAAAVATLLSAPASGKETRRYLVENKETWKKQLLELKDDLQNVAKSITVLSKEGKDELKVFIQDIKILIDSWKKEIAPNEEHLKNELQSIQDTLVKLESGLDIKGK